MISAELRKTIYLTLANLQEAIVAETAGAPFTTGEYILFTKIGEAQRWAMAPEMGSAERPAPEMIPPEPEMPGAPQITEEQE